MVDAATHMEICFGMEKVDAMPRDWVKLIHAYGADAEELYNNRVPATGGQGKPMTALQAAQILARDFGDFDGSMIREQFTTRKQRHVRRVRGGLRL